MPEKEKQWQSECATREMACGCASSAGVSESVVSLLKFILKRSEAALSSHVSLLGEVSLFAVRSFLFGGLPTGFLKQLLQNFLEKRGEKLAHKLGVERT